MTTCCFSQTIYPKALNDSLVVITNNQLKQTNLIFIEHQKLKQEAIEFQKQIQEYEKLKLNFEQVEQVNNQEIKLLNDELTSQYVQNEQLNKKLESQKKKLNLLKITSITGLAATIISVLFLTVK